MVLVATGVEAHILLMVVAVEQTAVTLFSGYSAAFGNFFEHHNSNVCVSDQQSYLTVLCDLPKILYTVTL